MKNNIFIYPGPDPTKNRMRLEPETAFGVPILKNLTYNLRFVPNRTWDWLEGNVNFRALQKIIEKSNQWQSINLILHPLLAEKFQQWDDKRNELLAIKKELDAPDCHDLYYQADKLWPWQRVDVKFAFTAEKSLILEPPGGGKTAIGCATLEAAREFRQVKKCIIICPNSARSHWKNNLLRWTTIPRYVRGDGVTDSKNIMIANAPLLSTKLLTIMAFIESSIDGALIMNWETIKLQQIDKVLQEACDAGKIDFIIADEIHRARNTNSKQSKTFVNLHAKFQMGLTGTPVVNKAEDLFPLVNWFYPDQYDNFQAFKEDFVDEPTRQFARVQAGMSESLKLELDHIMVRHEEDYIDEYLGLDKPIEEPETIELLPKQRKLYESMRDELIAVLENGDLVETSIRIAQINRLKQIAVSPASIPAVLDLHRHGKIDVETYKLDESSKFDWIEDFVDENPDEKVLVFSQFDAAMRLLEHRFLQKSRYKNKEQGIIYAASHKIIWGKSYDDMQILEDAWTLDPRIKLWLGTLKTGGETLNLQAGHIVILVDLWWNPASIIQAWHRLHRPGQTKPVRIIYLYAADTIEQLIKEMIDAKQDLSDLMIRPAKILELLRRDKMRGNQAA